MSQARQTEMMEGLNSLFIRSNNRATNAHIFIDEVLNESINGNVYSIQKLIQINTASYADIGFITPADKDIRYCGSDLSCDLNYAKAILYESATFTGNNALTLVNSNRQTANEASILAFDTFSVAVDLTGAISLDTVATLSSGFKGGGGTSQGYGFYILKRNTKYVIRIYNEDGATADVLIKLLFIETDLTD